MHILYTKNRPGAPGIWDLGIGPGTRLSRMLTMSLAHGLWCRNTQENGVLGLWLGVMGCGSGCGTSFIYKDTGFLEGLKHGIEVQS